MSYKLYKQVMSTYSIFSFKKVYIPIHRGNFRLRLLNTAILFNNWWQLSKLYTLINYYNDMHSFTLLIILKY